uniref:Putative ovule protein n=1 Tax=Solanum chacoense TaxID=4108 RepID=A0A0V0GMZ9_SOLCH
MRVKKSRIDQSKKRYFEFVNNRFKEKLMKKKELKPALFAANKKTKNSASRGFQPRSLGWHGPHFATGTF